MENNNYDNRPTGVFDSGVGGLTVLKKLKEYCPNENYIYYGDTKNLPYGEKSKEELLILTKRIFDFFKEKNVKAVVMACNTTAAQVYDELKNLYDFKLYPIIQIASECIAADKSIERIAVFATNATVNSGAYSKSLKQSNPSLRTFETACPEWVPIVEKKLTEYDDEVFLKYLKPTLEFGPQKIILGCTHYPYLLDKLLKYVPEEFSSKELFINPADSFAKYISLDLKRNEQLTEGKTEFYVSANPEKFLSNAELFLRINIIPSVVNF